MRRVATSVVLAGVLCLAGAQADVRETNGKKEFVWTQETLKDDRGLNEAWWIWHDKIMLADPHKREPLRLTKTVNINGAVKEAWLRISAQGQYTLFVNDRKVGEDDNVWTLDWYDIKPFLKTGENQLRVHAKTDEWFAGLFASGRIDLEKGDDIEIRSDGTWTVVLMDDVYKTPQEEPRPAGEVVRGVNGGLWNNCGRIFVFPDEYYRLGTSVETPGIAWARPFGGPKTRVVAIHPRARQRDTVELIQRSEMDVKLFPADVYPPNHEHTRAPFFPREKGLAFEDAARNIEDAFGEQADVIIFGGVSSYQVNGKNLFYDVAADKLKAFVRNGGGLVYMEGSIPPRRVVSGKKDSKGKDIIEQDSSFEKELTASPIANAPGFLAVGTPFVWLPGFFLTDKDEVKSYQKVASLYQYGKGRVVRLSRRIGGNFGLFANRGGDTNDLHYQYYMSFAIKAILWAAGQEPTLQFADFPSAIQAEQGHRPELAFRLTRVPVGCELVVSVRSPGKHVMLPSAPVCRQGQARGELILRPLFENTQAVKPGADVTVKVELPSLPAGKYFVDVQAIENTKKINWAVGSMVVSPKLDITSMQLSKEYIEVADGKRDSLGVTVELSEPAPGGTSVHLSAIDNFHRIVREEVLVIAGGAQKGEAVFPFRSFATTLGRMRAELRVEGEAVAVKLADFTAVRRDHDRYAFVGWIHGHAESHQSNVYLRMLGEMGVDAPRQRGIDMDWLEAVDMVACPGYPAFPRYGAEKIDQAELLKKYGEAARKSAEAQLRFDPIAFNNGDEFSYRGGEEQLSRVLEYRKFLEAKYGAIGVLNRTWGSSFQGFDEVFPILPEAQCQALKDKGGFYPRERFDKEAAATRNYSRMIDQWLDNYRAFNDTARVCLRAIKSVIPSARVGCDCPMWPEGLSGHDWYQFLQEFDYFAPYGRGGEMIPEREARSYFQPEKGQFIGLTYGGYLYMAFNRKEELNDVEWQRWRVWNGLFQGFTSLWWYNFGPGADEGNVSPGLQPYPTLQEPAKAIEQFRNGVYDLLKPQRATRDYGPIAIQDSVLSRLAVTFVPADFSGGSLGHNMDTHFLMRILEDNAGYNFTFVADPQLPQGELRKYKVLMMPMSIAVGRKEAEAMRQFAERGGILIADIRPGVFDGSGKWDEAQVVPGMFGLTFDKSLGRKMVTGDLRGELFGRAVAIPSGQKFPADPAVRLNGAKALCQIEGIPLVTCNPVGKGWAICLNIPFNYYIAYMLDSQYAYFGDAIHNRFIKTILLSLFDALDVKRPLKVEVAGDGEWPFWMDVADITDGRAQYIGVTKGRQSDWERSYEVTVHPKTGGHVYDVMDGKYLGEMGAIPMTVRPVEIKLLAVLPYKVQELRVRLNGTAVRRGGVLKGRVSVRCSGSRVRHVVNIRALRPDGEYVGYMARNVETPRGRGLLRSTSATFAIPIAHNELTGKWQLECTDVASGVKRVVEFLVE